MPQNPSADAALVRRAQQGEAEAATALYRQYGPPIFRYFVFRVDDEATAEDLTAEVFLQMVRGLQRYEDRGLPFSAWLFRVAHARLVDYRRRARVRQSEPLEETTLDTEPGPEVETIVRAETQQVFAAIRSLTDDQQMVIQLRFVEGYSLEITAEVMRKTIGAVKAMQQRALRRLATHVKP